MSHTLSTTLVQDSRREAAKTRALLEAVPAEHLDWKPHEKSMTLAQLAGHIAETPAWIRGMLEDELDFAEIAGDYQPFVPGSREELLSTHQANLAAFDEALDGKDDDFMRATWTMRMAEKVLMSAPRHEAVREVMLHHLAHHRGQLTVYLRLLEVPVPATYGATADHPMF